MDEDRSFSDLLRRVRQGDQEAAVELVRRHESAIRRTVRVRLVDARLKGVLDSMDICQSVLGSFFCRAALGQFTLEKPEDLIRLLVTMARNKVADQARRQATRRRGQGKFRAGDAAEIDVAGTDPTASRTVSARELLQAAWDRLSTEERWLAEQRVLERPWAELAAEVGTTPEALRKKHTRALDRVAQELGLDSKGLS
jgi:RNA polymerase sigma-70 factor (ECF subfamily)